MNEHTTPTNDSQNHHLVGVRMAADQGRAPEEVLADAWRQYFSTRVDELNENVLRARDELRSGETDVLVPEENSDVDRWAEEAAERLRRG